MMWGGSLIVFSYLAVQVTSQEIKVECREFHVFPPYSNITPSVLADLRVKLVTVGEKDMMNISWAINIDGVTTKPCTVPIENRTDAVPGNVNFTRIALAVFGLLAGLMILSSCYMIYKRCGANVASSLGFKRLPTSPVAPVPVLVVYPAEDSAFQQALVALTEFLQGYGGCSVAIDMWEQRKIAELGPMRWLAEKAKNAHRVLIVCPKSSSLPSHSPPNHTFPEPSIPASAHDLYPLILNMVAGHAKSASDLAKFCVVQLGEQQDKKPSNLALELRACKTFRLMKDLNKLCRSLHSESQDDKKISDLIFRPGFEKCTVKLREAVEKLQPNISRKAEPLKSVATIV
ncbi:interleukin-17 receptor B isoform X2 [Cyclopterus lumpus]|uniref:interleukin-17 receptor B isoform X2 n=1 Tax=Cyclopterus lumpus TaxID=8103 RepID=UPI0014871B11|nr:interleukin-17 receptor B isoform X2 [Cyclopterus lumpus]